MKDTVTSVLPVPLIVPLGESALLVRFSKVLSDPANRAAIAFARRLRHEAIEGVTEIAANLVSVLIKFAPEKIDGQRLALELGLYLANSCAVASDEPQTHKIHVRFGGADGPDLEDVAHRLSMTPDAFVEAHNRTRLRVLATGFAPGFVYCGFHPENLVVPRRAQVKPMVPPGSILFAAGQTAITGTAIPTGWNVIGRTGFINFDASATPPTRLGEGDAICFTASPR